MVSGKRDIVLIVHNIRSAHNVGSLLRTADGLGIRQVILSGYSPYPISKNDQRLPHIARSVDARIHKTALGAEKSVSWRHTEDIETLLVQLKDKGYQLAALEQAKGSIAISDFKPSAKTAIIIGSELGGIEPDLINKCDVILEIPMRGRKESFNVAAAAAMVLYHLTYLDKRTA